MNTIRSFAADDAHVIFGTVYDEALGDQLRVTVVATGLGNARGARAARSRSSSSSATGTDNLPASRSSTTATLESAPAVLRKNRNATIEALRRAGWTSSTSRRSCASRPTREPARAGGTLEPDRA